MLLSYTPLPRWRSTSSSVYHGRDAITSTCREARNSARSAWPGSSRIVRLQRSMTCTPSSRARTTSSRKWAFSSGAPPVMSRIRIEDMPMSATTSARVSRDISSVRCGPALTWQCTQVWLHRYPTLTCRVSRRRRWMAGKPKCRIKGSVACMVLKDVDCARRLLIEQSQQPLARGAQALREHEDQLHQDLGAEQRLLDDDAGQALAVEHGDQRRLCRDAGGEARLAVDHRHLAERPSAFDHRQRLRRVPAVALLHLDLAFDDHQHEIAAVAFLDDFNARLGAVHLHEMRQQKHLRRRKVLQQRAAGNKRVHLARELGGVAERFEVRELWRGIRHTLGGNYAESRLLAVLAALLHSLRQLGALELLAGRLHARRVIVRLPAATQDDVAVVVAARLHDRHLAALVHRQKMVLLACGEDRVHGDSHVPVGAILEADRRRQAGCQLAMYLAFSSARADRAPGHQVADVLRRDHVEELAAGGHSGPVDAHQQVARDAQPLVDAEAAVEVRIVDQAFPAHRGARLLEVHAHQQLELVAVTPSLLLQFPCIFQRRERIVDRARPHHYQPPVAAAVQDLAHAAARLADQALDRRALDRKEADQVLGRRQRDDVLDALVVGERGLVRRNAGEIAVWWRGHPFPFPKTKTARPFGWRFSQDPRG